MSEIQASTSQQTGSVSFNSISVLQRSASAARVRNTLVLSGRLGHVKPEIIEYGVLTRISVDFSLLHDVSIDTVGVLGNGMSVAKAQMG